MKHPHLPAENGKQVGICVLKKGKTPKNDGIPR
jgi:putative hemolysin